MSSKMYCAEASSWKWTFDKCLSLARTSGSEPASPSVSLFHSLCCCRSVGSIRKTSSPCFKAACSLLSVLWTAAPGSSYTGAPSLFRWAGWKFVQCSTEYMQIPPNLKSRSVSRRASPRPWLGRYRRNQSSASLLNSSTLKWWIWPTKVCPPARSRWSNSH